MRNGGPETAHFVRAPQALGQWRAAPNRAEQSRCKVKNPALVFVARIPFEWAARESGPGLELVA